MDIKTAINSFQIALTQYGQLQEVYGNPEMDAAYDALVNEYKFWFSEHADKTAVSQIPKGKALAEAIKKYCHPNAGRCPICGALMLVKVNRKTGNKFLGCPDYPTCQGTRDKDGRISVNAALKSYLLEMITNQASKPKAEPSRFDMIETDDE